MLGKKIVLGFYLGGGLKLIEILGRVEKRRGNY